MKRRHGLLSLDGKVEIAALQEMAQHNLNDLKELSEAAAIDMPLLEHREKLAQQAKQSASF